MGTKMDIANCAKALAEARTSFEEIKREKDEVERRMTAATNKLNDAQKTFDAAIEEVKADAPKNTNWHAQRNPPRAVA